MDTRYKDNFLFFDEGPHKYNDTLGNEYRSVTTLIGDYYNHFDADYWAHKKAREQGKSEKQIRAEWDRIKDEACERGTATHNGIEDAIKSVSKFKEAIKYLEEAKSGRCITIADIPALIPRPLNVEEFKDATNNKYPEIVYKTGDIGKYNEKGELIYLSRKDYQIKHMGYRIELGEIEKNIYGVDKIILCACIYDDVNQKIVLFYQGDIEENDLAKELESKLLPYMRPNKYIKLEKMPYNNNGKIDRKYLKEIVGK